MKIYDLDTVLEFGPYKGSTLVQAFKQDSAFVEHSLIHEKNFLIGEKALRDMQKLKPGFAFSNDALEQNDRKWARYDALNDTEYIDESFAGDIDEFDMEDFDEGGMSEMDDDQF